MSEEFYHLIKEITKNAISANGSWVISDLVDEVPS